MDGSDDIPGAAAASATSTSTTIGGGLITGEISTLQSLALRGQWKAILETTTRSLSSSPSGLLPHEHLVVLTFHALSLTKLRRYSDAADFIDSSVGDDMDSNPSYAFESYPQIYPGRTGSMLPFSLRWLHAYLPVSLRPTSSSLDRLYLLLHSVRGRIAADSSPEWARREQTVVATLVNIHSSRKEFALCLSLLDGLTCVKDDPLWLTKLGCIRLQYGDLEGARASFQIAADMSGSGPDKESNLVRRNRALMHMVGKDYVSAVREYEECIERDSGDAVAVNNKALCLMYLRDLSDSIKVLEGALERVPTAAVNETVVVNLCSMYELAFVNHGDLKRTLANWMSRVAPDDFDSSSTRI